MSLYNMVFGNSGQAPLVFALLGLHQGDFGRYRDSWIELPEGWKLLDVARDTVDTSERWYAAIDAIKTATPPNGVDPKSEG